MTQATFEILVLLTGALILGYILGWFMRKLKEKPYVLPVHTNVHTNTETTHNTHGAIVNSNEHTRNNNNSVLTRIQESIQHNYDKAHTHEAHDSEITRVVPIQEDEYVPVVAQEPQASVVDTQESETTIQDTPVQHTQTAATATNPRSFVDNDNLKIVEGIGPKIQELLNNNGIMNLQELSESNEIRLREILVGAGERYRIHDPSTWPEQARLAYEGKEQELKEYQDFLSGGKMLK